MGDRLVVAAAVDRERGGAQPFVDRLRRFLSGVRLPLANVEVEANALLQLFFVGALRAGPIRGGRSPGGSRGAVVLRVRVRRARRRRSRSNDAADRLASSAGAPDVGDRARDFTVGGRSRVFRRFLQRPALFALVGHVGVLRCRSLKYGETRMKRRRNLPERQAAGQVGQLPEFLARSIA